MTIEVLPYDPRWPEYARREIDRLGLPLIEHVGSTAVPGLAAKPVIDLMAAVGDLSEVRPVDYRLIETGMPERLFFRREATPVAYHLHVVLESSWAGRNERILRDHLRENPQDRDEYARLKLALAAAGHDGDAYTRAKTALIQRLVDDARTARGLPKVPVWEE